MVRSMLPSPSSRISIIATDPTTTVNASTCNVSKSGNSQVDFAIATAKGVFSNACIRSRTVICRYSQVSYKSPAGHDAYTEDKAAQRDRSPDDSPVGRPGPVVRIPSQRRAQYDSDGDQHAYQQHLHTKERVHKLA